MDALGCLTFAVFLLTIVTILRGLQLLGIFHGF